MPSNIVLSYCKCTTKRTTQEQQQEGHYRRDLKHVFFPNIEQPHQRHRSDGAKQHVLFYNKRTITRTTQEKQQEGLYRRGIKRKILLLHRTTQLRT